MVYAQGLIVKELVVSFQLSVVSNPLNPPYQGDFERGRVDRGDRVWKKKDLLFRWMCSTIQVI